MKLFARLALASLILLGALVLAITLNLYAATIPVSTHLRTNGDGTQDTRWPNGDKPINPSTGVKWNPGFYGDCNQDGAAPFVAIGNANYIAIKACIDYYAAAGGMTGVFIKASWTSFEGDTPGSYSGTVGNSMGATGTIGHLLWDDLLAYAATKGMKVHIGIEWFSQGTPSCTYPYPKYLVQPACFGSPAGTDSAGTYGVTVTSDGLVWIRIWKAAVMDRFIAMVSDLGARYDNNATLDAVSILWDDSSFTGGNPGPDGFSFTNLVTQLARFATNVRAAAPNTGFYAMVNFMPRGDTANLFAAFGSAQNYMFYAEQDAEVWLMSDGDSAYVGESQWGGHDYRGEIPMAIRLSQTTQCTNHDSYAAQNGLSASQNTTPSQYYSYWFTNGKTDAPGKPIRPSYVIVGKIIGDTCPSVDHQQFAGTNGWLQYLQSHPLNTTRPSKYP